MEIDAEKTREKLMVKLKKEPSNFELYNALFQLVKMMPDSELKWKKSEEVKEVISEGIKERVSCCEELGGLYEDVLLMEARGLRLDSYMQYLELNREPEKRFWLPRRKQLMIACDAIQDLIDDKLDIVTISMPPGSGKSTLKIFLYTMLLGAFPDKPCLESAHSSKLTDNTYNGVLQILNDPYEYRWHEIFPEAKEVLTNAKDTLIDINKKHRFASLTCRSIDGTLTGATRCEGFLTADDLVSGIEEAMSITRLDSLMAKYTNDLKSRKKLGCKELHIATRWSVHDVIGRLQRTYEGDPRFKSIVMPALNENGESNFDYDFGVGFDTAFFNDVKRNMDDVSFKALYMNEPIEREGLLYPNQSLKRYYDLPAEMPDAIISVCDTKDRGVDYCVMPICYMYGDNCYIEDVICDNSLPEVFTPRLVSMLVKHNVQMAKFESNTAGGVVSDNVRNAIKNYGCRCSIQTEYTTQNKETKILVNADWVKANCYFKDASLIQGNTDYIKFMDMLCSYTHEGKNKHDDAPDAMAMLAIYAQSFHKSHDIRIFKRPW